MRRYMYIRRLKGDTYYQKKKAYLNAKVCCPCCSKLISRQNVRRHLKNIHHKDAKEIKLLVKV